MVATHESFALTPWYSHHECWAASWTQGCMKCKNCLGLKTTVGEQQCVSCSFLHSVMEQTHVTLNGAWKDGERAMSSTQEADDCLRSGRLVKRAVAFNSFVDVSPKWQPWEKMRCVGGYLAPARAPHAVIPSYEARSQIMDSYTDITFSARGCCVGSKHECRNALTSRSTVQ